MLKDALNSFIESQSQPVQKQTRPVPSLNTNGFNINNYFSNIYLINLRKRPDRLVKVLQKLRKLNIKVQVINAIDGSKEQYFAKYQEYLKSPINESSHPLEQKKRQKIISSPGAWGYLLTWKVMLQDARKNGYRSFLSLDDDVIFAKDFHQRFESWIRNIPINNWKILQLGATQLSKLRLAIDTQNNWFNPGLTDGSYATAVHSSVYNDLLREVYKMNAPLDSGPLRTIYQKYPDSCYVAWPHLIIADVADSDIRGKKNLERVAQQLEWRLDQYDWNFSLDLISVVLWIPKCNHGYNIGRIKQVIRRFLDQKYSKMDLILINDSTNSEITSVLNKFLETCKNIRLVNNVKSLDEKVCREMGINMARGSYVIFQRVDENTKTINHEIELKIIGKLQQTV